MDGWVGRRGGGTTILLLLLGLLLLITTTTTAATFLRLIKTNIKKHKICVGRRAQKKITQENIFHGRRFTKQREDQRWGELRFVSTP
jgi:uncharacterized metal-binding protein